MLKARVIPCLDVKDGPFVRSGVAARTGRTGKAAVRC
ncbi:hypothetical protein SAMN05216548_10599 [Faunimonas pinastri]|uniref:Uncharacterized protein n=1 Tax=Faunimonas pinastri TaxID=1855383 RepID=A0A1H9GNU3_9HYPH|nr:hypothetical protein SAMN05216548_10599 [Faunimonas pinastri]